MRYWLLLLIDITITSFDFLYRSTTHIGITQREAHARPRDGGRARAKGSAGESPSGGWLGSYIGW